MQPHIPVESYNNPVKADYRERVWSAIEQLVPRKGRARCRVAVLGSWEGLEVEFLQRRGYSPENILAVNFSHGQLAWMNRNLRLRGLQPVPVAKGDLVDVLLRRVVRNQQRFDAVNADFCGSLCPDRLADIATLGKILPSKAVLAVTVQGGREHDFTLRQRIAYAGRPVVIRDAAKAQKMISGAYVTPAPCRMEWAVLKLP